jgi:molybdopterin-binding protein
MRISNPNKLIGRIMEIKPGQEMTEVIIDIGDMPLTATITAGAAADMNLNKGDEVFAMFNSTDITLIKDS